MVLGNDTGMPMFRASHLNHKAAKRCECRQMQSGDKHEEHVHEAVFVALYDAAVFRTFLEFVLVFTFTRYHNERLMRIYRQAT